MRVTIQGYEGSFHQVAVHKFFGRETGVVCCATFKDVLKKAAGKEADAAVMAIENSIAGSILPNYTLLQKSTLRIIGEVYLDIKQNLLVNKGVKFEDIREVHSHPMALLQCADYLDKHHWKLVESEDTALSAKQIARHGSKHTAAIAGKLAAELFHLDIIAPNIHSLKKNYTRFLVLRNESEDYIAEDANKASLVFSTYHKKGSLATVLGKIAAEDVNLSKLQSMPIPGSEFLYAFHADLEFDTMKQFEKAVTAIKPYIQTMRVFGIYRNGKQFKG